MVGIPKGAVPIGSRLYLFKASSNAAGCLISAHGGYRRGNLSFTVPVGVTISFYGMHGYVLQDPGVKIMGQDLTSYAVETRQAGEQCTDYILSKYQGAHNRAGETYESIEATIRDFQLRFAQKQERLKSLGDPGGLTGAKLMQHRIITEDMKSLNAMNVVTIRNRWNGGEVMLSEVIAAVKAEMKGIAHFHCSFCRGHVDNDNAPTWKVGKGHI